MVSTSESNLLVYQTQSEQSAGSEDEAITPLKQTKHLKKKANREAFQQYLETLAKFNDTDETFPTAQTAETLQGSNKTILKARDYQQELFERAVEENIIAVLDTGSGKTLIAVLLIKYVLKQEIEYRAQGKTPRMVFFLVNSVHLVHQQARFLNENLPTAPAALHGNSVIDSWKREDWMKVYTDTSVVVCTAAILDQCLFHSFLTMDQISLLVFDEAHHCKKNHPYSRIIRDYYVEFNGPKPRIFGMTASPVDSNRNIHQTVANLEELLNSKIVTTRDGSLYEFAHKPRDVSWSYDCLQIPPLTDLHNDIYKLCGFVDELRKHFGYSRFARSELGAWCADRIWFYVLAFSESQSTSFLKKMENSKQYATFNMKERDDALKKLNAAINLVRQNTLQLPQLDGDHLSSKVLVLVNGLVEFYNSRPKSRAIVFVERRMTATILNDVFQCLRIEGFRSGVLIGVGIGEFNSVPSQNQEQIMKDFRDGSVNLIFATSVAEEGIDIPQCNLVIRFDLYKTPIQYMQSRGRARMKDSIYVHMIEKNNVDQKALMDYAIDMDKYIRDFCNALPPDRLLGNGTKLAELIAKDRANKSFRTSSGTICNFSNCLTILNRYATSLEVEEGLRTEVYEEFINDNPDGNFRYTVRLPVNEDSTIQEAHGEPRQSKVLAKRSAAFNCVFLLRAAGLVDENLDSVFKKTKPANLNARIAVSEAKNEYVMTTKPRKFWDHGVGTVPDHLFAYVIRFRPHGSLRQIPASLMFFVRLPLPSFPGLSLFLEENIQVDVSFNGFDRPLPVTLKELGILTSYTLNAVFADVFNKTYEFDPVRLPYWLAPAAQVTADKPSTISSLLDIAATQVSQEERVKWSPGMKNEDWCNKFLVDPWNGRYHYFSRDIIPDTSVCDPIPEGLSSRTGKGKRENIIDFTDSRWKASKQKSRADKYDHDQPVVNAEMYMTRRNFLDKGTDKEIQPIFCPVAVQPLEIGRIGCGVAITALAWPCIIHRLESYLIVAEAFKELDLSEVPVSLGLESFTKDNFAEDHEDEIDESKLGARGNSYERLEFIGDSLLKMMTTITIFNLTKCNEEGMHCRRMDIISNRHLYCVATGPLELSRYIRTKSFNREQWYPENLVLTKGRGVKNPPEAVRHPDIHHHLSMKTIADVSEAIIGAAVMSSRDQTGTKKFDLGIKAITRLVESDDHKITSWAQINPMYNAPDWQMDMNDPIASDIAAKVGAKIGYEFKYPRLIRSAFTHPSDTNSPVPDYQRLEFLGDAVLDWVCIWWLFENHENKGPQWLTEHKMAMVSNKFLAALAVLLDFDKFIFVASTQHLDDIMTYAKRVRSNPHSDKTHPNFRPDFWTQLDRPPKVLSDLVESTIGAILIDSGFDYFKVETFFQRHIQRFFRNIEDYDDFANRHPTTYLISRLQQHYECLNFDIQSHDAAGPVEPGNINDENRNTTDVKMRFSTAQSGVLIHGKVVALAKGESAKYSRVRACKQALGILGSMGTKEEFKEKFGCDCRSGKK